MVAVRLTGIITADHRLIVDVPEDIPPGEVVIEIRVSKEQEAVLYGNEPTRRARAMLSAKGRLSTVWKAPEGYVPLTVEERMKLGKLPPGAISNDQIVDEDRGECRRVHHR